jgi:hypothetical protein
VNPDTFFSAVAAAGAAFATVASVYGIKLAAQNLQAANETVVLAAESRLDSERDRRRHRLERVGELVEEAFWLANDMTRPKGWMPARNRLRQALVGLTDELPLCAGILDASISEQAIAAASSARDEIEMALRRLEVSG